MKKLKVATVIGTRPEIIRLSRVLAKLDAYCDHIVVHTGQNYDYELNEIFFRDLELRKPDYFLNSAGRSAAQTIGNVISNTDELLASIQPDALLVLGDTNSCLSVLPAKRRKIPTFHMEAGNRCFDQRVPEEINRRVVDHIADVNLTYSGLARDYLIQEGLPQDLVIKTGSPLFEVINYYRSGIQSSKALSTLGLEREKFFLVSVHREENIENEKQFTKFAELLNGLAGIYRLPIIVSTHPRTRRMIEQAGLKFAPQVTLMKPLGYFDYVNLQTNARAVLSDSGTINEESSILNFPAINLREAHERPEGMEQAAVMMLGFNFERVMQGLNILEAQSRGDDRTLMSVADYSVPNVSEKIVRIIHSYTDYVKRVIWRGF